MLTRQSGLEQGFSLRDLWTEILYQYCAILLSTADAW